LAACGACDVARAGPSSGSCVGDDARGPQPLNARPGASAADSQPTAGTPGETPAPPSAGWPSAPPARRPSATGRPSPPEATAPPAAILPLPDAPAALSDWSTSPSTASACSCGSTPHFPTANDTTGSPVRSTDDACPARWSKATRRNAVAPPSLASSPPPESVANATEARPLGGLGRSNSRRSLPETPPTVPRSPYTA